MREGGGREEGGRREGGRREEGGKRGEEGGRAVRAEGGGTAKSGAPSSPSRRKREGDDDDDDDDLFGDRSTARTGVCLFVCSSSSPSFAVFGKREGRLQRSAAILNSR